MHPELEDAVLRIAASQHGIVARRQLLAAGMSVSLVDYRVRLGGLVQVHRSIYCIPALSDDRSRMTALVLSFGPHAAASHHTAAELRGWHSERHPPAAVSVARGKPEPRPGAQIHRVRIGADEICTCDGIPVTTVARTLLDLATIVSDRQLEQAAAAASRSPEFTEASVVQLLGRYPRRAGTPRLRRLLAAPAELAFTRSEAEERFLHLMRLAHLPAPVVNSKFLRFEVDFLWRAQRLAVEIDGLEFHSSRVAQQADRRRDAALVAAGFRVLRFTWSDLVNRPEATLATVASALARPG